MDITFCVKRNNSALAQYDSIVRCTAQNGHSVGSAFMALDRPSPRRDAIGVTLRIANRSKSAKEMHGRENGGLKVSGPLIQPTEVLIPPIFTRGDTTGWVVLPKST